MLAGFDWKQAPLSSRTAPIVASVAYLAVTALLRRIVPESGLRGLHWPFTLHNVVLSAWSFIMFTGCLMEMVMRAKEEKSIDWMFCEVPQQTARGRLYFWSYVFYLSKYYEMVDTMFALLKGSRTPHFGLHVYHHALVPLMIWHWLEYCGTLQFIGLLFNTGVHTFMYAYYAAKVLGLPTAWKRWITRMQIAQFVVGLSMVGVTVAYVQGDVFGTSCAGLMTMWVNTAFNGTLLWQFVGVLHPMIGCAREHTARNGHVNGHSTLHKHKIFNGNGKLDGGQKEKEG